MKQKKIIKITALAVATILIAGVVAIRILGIKAEGTETIDTSKWDLNKVEIVYDEDGIPVPVPKGYTASSVDGEHKVNTGFVIYEGEEDLITDTTKNMEDGNEKEQAINTDIENAQKTRNQWVWVPVNDINDIYTIDSYGNKKGRLWAYSDTGRTSQHFQFVEPDIAVYSDYSSTTLINNLEDTSKSEFNKEMHEEFELTIKSIEKYGGFYIGRYEVGDISQPQAKVVKGNIDISSDKLWYTVYKKTKFLHGGNKNVRTNMIWGCLWDETLEWLVKTKFTDSNGTKDYKKVGTDSTMWGNYLNATFEYTDINGNLSTKEYKKYQKIPTGSTEYTNANNIYDLGGNIAEWTMEVYHVYYRIVRGGMYFDMNTPQKASYRYSDANVSYRSSYRYKSNSVYRVTIK